MEITVKANGGLGNRMRVLASCIALSQQLRSTIQIIWENNAELNCSYAQLFQPVEGIEIIEKGYIPWYQRWGLKKRKADHQKQKSAYEVQIGDSEIRQLKHLKSDFLKLIKEFNSVYVDTCESFYGDASFLAYLLPTEEINAKVLQRQKQLSSHYIGVHIRRGDNSESQRVSTSNHFNRAITDILDTDMESVFYVCTDSPEEAERLVADFGKSIHYFPVGLSRNKQKDIQMALVDLLVLSGSTKILGSYWSSFSEVAAGYGSIPIEMVGLEA